MTDRLNPDAQAALDAVREGKMTGQWVAPGAAIPGDPDIFTFMRATAAALENLDARLKALEAASH